MPGGEHEAVAIRPRWIPRIVMEVACPQDVLRVDARYANFCRVTGTPEEVIVDFALNSQPMGVPVDPIVTHQRLVINYFTAKRLLGALHVTVQRHEQAFGVLETDINKRVKRV